MVVGSSATDLQSRTLEAEGGRLQARGRHGLHSKPLSQETRENMTMWPVLITCNLMLCSCIHYDYVACVDHL